MIAEKKGVMKTSTLKRNKLGQVVTSFETFKWFDEEKSKIISGYNLDYLPKEFTVFGKLKGRKVFEINNSDLQPVNLNSPSTREIVTVVVTIIVGVATIGVAIWAALRTKKTTTTVTIRDNNGNVTGTATAVSEDPIPFEIEINNRVYTVDEYGIDFSKQIPENLIGNPAVEYDIIAEQITGTNLSEFEITSIEIEKN